MKRYLSPIRIYKFQFNSILSIIHRLTGIVTFFSIFLFVYWLWILSCGVDLYLRFIIFFCSWVGYLFFPMILFSFSYHMFNGVRHLFWDMGFGFSKRQIYYSGFFILLLSIIFTVVSFLFFYLNVFI